jgi:hypothetical protein
VSIPRWSRSPRRRLAAALAAVLYLGSAVAVPLVHAETEQLIAPTAIEAGHTAQCPKIHGDLSCPTVSSFRILPTVVTRIESPPSHRVPIATSSTTPPPARSDVRPAGGRAPPAI